ncbi:hypothetical protein [Aneurinibacillus migulanus]|uniref:hypothetical protein n=1 Tax=Aneurinibacillus migulanus TaxID=47500 RepID=UPI00209DE09D|nr:hypothetical protein [Aneurinibacillus migulanus]MCP1355421.1 hypothetical protein [Aneurinibacillus migulanus]
MKKVLATALTIGLALSLSACSTEEKPSNSVTQQSQTAPTEKPSNSTAQQSQTAPTEKPSNSTAQQSQPAPIEKPKPANASEVVKSMKESGLHIGKTETYTASNDPNNLLGRPGQYTSKVNFVDTSIKTDVINSIEVTNGGSVEMFDNEEDAKNRYDYISGIAKKMGGPFSEYDYLEGKVLIRVSKEFTPDQAKRYEKALKDIFK